MADSLRTLVKSFSFREEDRQDLVFSNAVLIMLDSQAGYGGAVTLRPADGVYSTAARPWVIARLASPGAARRLLGLEAAIDHVKLAGAVVTTEGFRLYDGTSHYFWNGSAWIVVSSGSSIWNTEGEVATNITAFPLLPGRRFSVVVALGTTDRRYTPVLHGLKVAYEARLISMTEEILYRTVARALAAGARPLADVVLPIPAATSTIDVGGLVASSGIPFNLAGVEAVFNRDDDPELLTDLLATYDSSTKVATLSAPIPAGKLAQVVIRHAPEVVVVSTHPDYTEVGKVPSYVIDDVQEVDSALTAQQESVVDKAGGGAIVIPAPYQGTIRFRVTGTGPSPLDAARMVDALKDWATRNQLLRSPALDEQFRLLLRGEYSGNSTPTGTGEGSASCTMEVQNVPSFSRPAAPGYAVRNVRIDYTKQ
jgi:hypothetical protein